MDSTARALRKMIAELAEMPAGACSAVLGALDQDQAARVRALLEEYRADAPSAVAYLDLEALPQDLSPWLIELLQIPDDAGRVGAGRTVTDRSSDALRACAAELGAGSGDAAGPDGRLWPAIAKRLPLPRWKAAAR